MRKKRHHCVMLRRLASASRLERNVPHWDTLRFMGSRGGLGKASFEDKKKYMNPVIILDTSRDLVSQISSTILDKNSSYRKYIRTFFFFFFASSRKAVSVVRGWKIYSILPMIERTAEYLRWIFHTNLDQTIIKP